MGNNFVRKYPVLFGSIGFVVLTLPQTISSYLDLWQRFEEADVHINWFQWVFPILPILGLGLFAIVLWQTRKPTSKTVPSQEQAMSKESADSLLNLYINEDKANLGKRLFARDWVWLFDNLKATDSFMRMTVTIINTSVFPILIESIPPKDRFLIEGEECAYPAELEGRTRIPRGESGNISIKQHVSQEMMNWIFRMHMQKQTIKISLKSCHLVMRPDIAERHSEPIDIGLTFAQEVPIELKRE